DTLANVYVTGRTQDLAPLFFPTVNAIQPNYGGGLEDAFVAKINASGSAFVYSTFLGGSGDDVGQAIALDSSGNVYVTGYTTSTNFPTSSPLQPTFGGGSSDAFVAKINATGSAFVYSTYLGGRGGEY